MNINNLQTHCFRAAFDKGFWDVPKILEGLSPIEYVNLKKMEKLGLIVTEIAEGMEAVRKPKPDEHCPNFSSEEIELADAVIRIMDYAGGFGLRLEEAIEAKLTFNESRPHKHGKKF